jgi:WhiB family redox-sensing transcriptional regulator
VIAFDVIPTDWMVDALCAEIDPEGMYPEDGHHVDAANAAISLCRACPVQTQCLTYALTIEHGVSARHRYGIWGGLTPAQRWRLVAAQEGAA